MRVRVQSPMPAVMSSLHWGEAARWIRPRLRPAWRLRVRQLMPIGALDLIPEPARYPVIAMPTTAGTGSEASRVSVIADSEGKRRYTATIYSRASPLVDPLLQRTLPPLLTAVTGLDVLGHALECTASKKSHALGDAVAREAMQAGAAAFVGAIDNGVEDGAARYGMARCALLAGLLLSPINTGAGHALGYGIEKISYERGNPGAARCGRGAGVAGCNAAQCAGRSR